MKKAQFMLILYDFMLDAVTGCAPRHSNKCFIFICLSCQ